MVEFSSKLLTFGTLLMSSGSFKGFFSLEAYLVGKSDIVWRQQIYFLKSKIDEGWHIL